MQPGDLDTKLAPVPGFGQGDVAQVEFHIKVGILQPVGPIKPTRDFNDAGAKQWQFAEAPFESRDDVLEADETAGRGGGIVDAQAANVLRRVGLLEVDKSCVKYSQLFHAILLPVGRAPGAGRCLSAAK